MASGAAPRTPILHVVQGFPPESRGGVETYVEQIARAQRERGRDARVLAASPEGRDEIVEHEGIPVRFVPAADPQREHLDPEGVARELRLHEHLDWSGARLLHVHHWSGLGQRLVRSARELGVPAWVTLHDLFATCPFFFRLRDELCAANLPVETCAACASKRTGVPIEMANTGLAARRREFNAELRCAERVWVNSDSQSEYLSEVPELEGVDLQSLALPTPKLPRAHPVPDAPEAYDGKRPLRVISWGGLVRGKGLHLIVDAAAELPPGSLELTHLGPVIDPAYAEELTAKSRACDLDLHLLGRYQPSTLVERAPSHDLAVFPSLFLETYGYTTDEALALGLPVLVSDRGAPRERIGSRGRTFGVGDASDLARELTRLMDDPRLLTELRNGAPGRRLSLGEHVDALETFE